MECYNLYTALGAGLLRSAGRTLANSPWATCDNWSCEFLLLVSKGDRTPRGPNKPSGLFVASVSEAGYCAKRNVDPPRLHQLYCAVLPNGAFSYHTSCRCGYRAGVTCSSRRRSICSVLICIDSMYASRSSLGLMSLKLSSQPAFLAS